MQQAGPGGSRSQPHKSKSKSLKTGDDQVEDLDTKARHLLDVLLHDHDEELSSSKNSNSNSNSDKVNVN